MSKVDAGAFLRLAQEAAKYRPENRESINQTYKNKVKKAEASYQQKSSPWSTVPDVAILKLSIVILIYTMYEDDGILDKKESKTLKKAIKMLGLSKEETNELMNYTTTRVHTHALHNYIEKNEFKPGSVIYAANIILDLGLKNTSKKLIQSIINDFNEKRNL